MSANAIAVGSQASKKAGPTDSLIRRLFDDNAIFGRAVAAIKPKPWIPMAEFQENASFARFVASPSEIISAHIHVGVSHKRIVTSVADAAQVAIDALIRAEQKRAQARLRESLFYERTSGDLR